MLKGFKDKNQCYYLYLWTNLVSIVCIIVSLFIIYGCKFTMFHVIRIPFLIFFCCEFVLLNSSLFWSSVNKTLVIKKDIQTYEDCLKFFEKMSVYKQGKHYFKLLQIVPLMEKGDYHSIEEILQYMSKEAKLNVLNQILLEFYSCLYKKRNGKIDDFVQEKNAFCEKWNNRKVNRKARYILKQSISFLECNEEGCAVDEKKKSILITQKDNMMKRIIRIIIYIVCILCINQIEGRKHSNIEDAYSVGKNIFDCQYRDLNIVYRKNLEKFYIEVVENDDSFFYYIYEKEEIAGEGCYYLKTYYGDEKNYLNQCSFGSLIYGQMYRSKRYLSEKNDEFPAIGIVNEQSIGNVYLASNRKPDEIKEVKNKKETYYIWFYKEVTEKEMTEVLKSGYK